MNLIPGLSLRASEEAEVLGIDDAELGEFAVRNPFLLFSLLSHSLTVRLRGIDSRGYYRR